MARHNKKRNVGLIYELLIQRLSRAIVENDKKKVTIIQGIIKNRFKKGTELYKEFRLFNALVTTSGASEQLAYRILNEAQIASRDHDGKLLDREKSLLIKDVNHKLNEANFYNTKVKNYPVYASAQQLFNGWRGADLGIAEIAKHEMTVHSWLVRCDDKTSIEDHKTPHVNNLTFNVMQEKFEKKYGSSLTGEQSELLRLYCEGNQAGLVACSREISRQLSRQIAKYKKNSRDNFLVEKVNRVNAAINDQELSTDINDVSKMMTMAQLLAEIREFTNVNN